ncbi:GNAT family N-acetyltransferase [Chitinophagales bacterium]|nr:GNAT family N-acetyltransferase [Chitinophagales bacterium]
MNETITIRFAETQDLPSIVAIYNQAIKSKTATADIHEFELADRITWFEKYSKDSYPIYVAELNKEVVAYATLSPYRPGRAALSKVAEISYYVDFSFHGKGIGTELLEHVIADCKRINKKFLLAILMDVNVSSVGILNKFNFQEWGVLPGIVELEDSSCGHLIYGLDLGS